MFHTKESEGIVKKVWAFADLTMQEFSSAIFLHSTSWTDQCMSARYIAPMSAKVIAYTNLINSTELNGDTAPVLS